MSNKWSVGIWLSESVVKPFGWWGCYDVVFFPASAPRLYDETAVFHPPFHLMSGYRPDIRGRQKDHIFMHNIFFGLLGRRLLISVRFPTKWWSLSKLSVLLDREPQSHQNLSWPSIVTITIWKRKSAHNISYHLSISSFFDVSSGERFLKLPVIKSVS